MEWRSAQTSEQLRFETIDQRHAESALERVLSGYEKERAHVPALPPGTDFRDSLKHEIGGLFKRRCGIAALADDRLAGFLSAYEADELFGRCAGVYVPVFGHGVANEYGRRLYQELYARAADLWVRKGLMSHAATFFAHDKETVETWFWLGFGLRCVDAIREAARTQVHDCRVDVKKADLDDIPSIADIHATHFSYYRSSPIFMYKPLGDPSQDLLDWMSNPHHHLWIACVDGELLGYIRIEPSGESFVSRHPSVMNITGAYVVDDRRGSGIGVSLLAGLQQWLVENGYKLCGVDFESINSIGSRFWTRHFTPYTYSMVRRIDERILEHL
jgi:GNAT superfamily N-acetyltransferase